MSIKPLMLLPFDPVAGRTGGIRTWATGFIARAPSDFEPHVVGGTTAQELPLRRWTTLAVGGRDVRFLPVIRLPEIARPRVPATLGFGVGLWRCRNLLPMLDTVVQVHRPGSDLALRGGMRPRVRVVHNTSRDLSSGTGGSRWPLLPGALNRVESSSLAGTQLIYAIGDTAADVYRVRYPALASRIRTTTNFYDENVFRPPDAGERIRLRAELEIAAEEQVVLFVGRLEQQKDPLLLAEAFARLGQRRVGVRLMVLGDGALRAPLEARLRSLGIADRTQLLGINDRRRVAELMRAADLLCLSSVYETGPTVGLEALASGLAVVMPAIGQVSRIVATDERAGRVVAERSAAALADGMAQTLEVASVVRCAAAARLAAPYSATRVLEPIYDDHRRLVEEARR